jgi:predicted double-glycine peptidase
LNVILCELVCTEKYRSISIKNITLSNFNVIKPLSPDMVVLTDPEYMVIIGKIPQYRRIVAYISKCGYLDILVVAGIIRHMYAKQAAAIATNILVEDVIHGDTIDIYTV